MEEEVKQSDVVSRSAIPPHIITFEEYFGTIFVALPLIQMTLLLL
jgi:hypothetical protein